MPFYRRIVGVPHRSEARDVDEGGGVILRCHFVNR
jgi:hypothetical protein